MFELEFDEDWDYWFSKAPQKLQKRFINRREKYENYPIFEHAMHGKPYFKDKIEKQYRVLFVSDEKKKIRRFYFIGDHKQYEKWLNSH